MAAYPIRERLLPKRIYHLLMEEQRDWLILLEPGVLEMKTGAAARDLRYRYHQIIDALDWLKEYGYIKSFRKVKRNHVIIRLKTPPNVRGLDD